MGVVTNKSWERAGLGVLGRDHHHGTGQDTAVEGGESKPRGVWAVFVER
jgi:hypothetical protein